MNTTKFPILPINDIKTLGTSLIYLKMSHLRDICDSLDIPATGTKLLLIDRILTFIQTGNIVKPKPTPKISCAEKGKLYPLSPETLILKGSYRNDLKTRLFFKKIIGEYFHYTAFGHDWIRDRWMNSNPPTYQEFAKMWIEKYKEYKNKTIPPKKEWAYINFVQDLIKKESNLSNKELKKAWKDELQRHFEIASKILDKITKKD